MFLLTTLINLLTTLYMQERDNLQNQVVLLDIPLKLLQEPENSLKNRLLAKIVPLKQD